MSVVHRCQQQHPEHQRECETFVLSVGSEHMAGVLMDVLVSHLQRTHECLSISFQSVQSADFIHASLFASQT